MKVLVINLDKGIFRPDSASLSRLKQYATFCEKLSVIVLTLQKFSPIKEGNLEIFATGSRSRFKYFSDARKLVKEILNKEKMDLVMTQDPFETGFLGWLVKRKYKMSWQCQVHGDILSPYFSRESIINKARVLLAKFLLPRADGIRVVSERIKKSLMENLKLKENPFVLPIFVNTEKLRSAQIKINLKEKYPKFDFIAIMASRISREKNIGLAVEAFAEIVKVNKKAGLVIVGEGKDKNRLERKAAELNLQGNLIFEPWSDDLASYYKTADLFLLTSNYEGWGMSVVEAAACGCPIIMTDVGCAGEFIKNNENGFVVGVGDKKALVERIVLLIKDENLRQKLSESSQMTVSGLTGEKEYLESYKHSLLELLKK
jgi:glycosyltransferase involved in cell wall biosynthesis